MMQRQVIIQAKVTEIAKIRLLNKLIAQDFKTPQVSESERVQALREATLVEPLAGFNSNGNQRIVTKLEEMDEHYDTRLLKVNEGVKAKGQIVSKMSRNLQKDKLEQYNIEQITQHLSIGVKSLLNTKDDSQIVFLNPATIGIPFNPNAENKLKLKDEYSVDLEGFL